MDISDEIVISGISGRFPECNNVEEFKEALLKGADLLTKNEKRYPTGYKNLPDKCGIVKEIDKFDAVFFGMNPKDARHTSTRHRILLETACESMFDAGYNPNELRGTRTGVFVAIPMTAANIDSQEEGFFYLGHSSFQAANRMSFSFDFKGPSYTMDTACSSSLYAFSNAVAQLKSGEIDYAIVSGATIILDMQEVGEFAKLNLLGDACKVFNKDRHGFGIGEAVVSYFLTRKSKSRRIYATVLGAKTNIDGFKKEGLLSPSASTQAILVKELLEEANISVENLEYIEMHGTGTQVGDIVECQSILNAVNDRKKPLLVGSVKTNTGHTLQASGLVGLTKVIIAMETGIIPKNLFTDNIDDTLPGIGDGKLQIIKTNTAYNDGVIGVNSFGIGGANAHIALKPFGNRKSSSLSTRDHRLVQVSGRTEEAVTYLLDEIEKSQNDQEFLSLLDEIYKTNVEGHFYRGYTVLGKTPKREVIKYKTGKRPIWYIFSGMGSQWPGMGRALMHLKVFRKTFKRCAMAIKPYGVDLEKIIMDGSKTDLDDIENCFSAIMAITVSLTDLLASLGIEPDFIAGHSVGEIGCGYANGDITPEQAVLLAYSRGYACKQTTLPLGQMLAVGMSKNDVKTILPEDIYVASHNSKNSVTVSGPQRSVKTFAQELTQKGIFNKLIDTANIAFHSKYLMDANKYMLEFVQQNVLKDPKPRLSKWKSTSVPPEKQEETWAGYNSAEYHVNNFMNPILFDQIFPHIQHNAIVIEIAPHALLRSILKRELGPENTLIGLMNRTAEDQEEYLLSSIGQIFLAGVQPNLRNLYREVSFPVRRATKMLSPLIKWDHNISYPVPKINPHYFGQIVTVNISNEKYAFYKGHHIDGRVLMPAAAYLELVWTVLANNLLKKIEDLPVIFEDVKFLRGTVLPEDENIHFLINIFRETGYFEIFESKSIVCSGKITVAKDITNNFITKEITEVDNDVPVLKREDVYKEYSLARYNYKVPFQPIYEISLDGHVTKLEWSDFTTFLDGMIHIVLFLVNKNRDLMLTSSIKKLVIDPKAHLAEAKQKYCTVFHDPYLNVLRSRGIEMLDGKLAFAPMRQKTQADPLLESYQFVHYNSLNKNYDFATSLQIALGIIVQNNLTKFLNIAEITDSTNSNTTIESILKNQILIDIDYSTIYPKDLKEKYDVILLNTYISETYNINSFSNNLKNDGFIIFDGRLNDSINQLDVIFQTPCISLLRLSHTFPVSYDTLNIRNSDFKWLEKLQTVSKSSEKKTLFLFSQNEPTSGLIGLTKCLMKEDTKVDFKAILIDQSTDMFNVNDKFYRKQLSKNLNINVLRNDNWGTYVHIPLGEIGEKIVKNAKVSLKTLGNLATLCWVEMPGFLPKDPQKLSEIVDVKYMALNFRDTLIATGDLHVDVLEPTDDDIDLGYEFSGVTKSGRRVMGLRFVNPFNIQLQNNHGLMWDVPNHWTMEEAASVPIVYATCYYALITRGQMEEGNSILIHAGSGGIGIAAIRIALSLKAKIFTTVSTQEKKDFLLKMFPQLEENNIGNSRDTSFFNLIKTKTKGRGVDIVLNSLAGDLFQASINLLAPEGKFIELGKKDFSSGSHIRSELFLNNCSMHGISLDDIFKDVSKGNKKIFEIVQKGIDSGVIKPLPTTVFEKTQLEDAWRYLAVGKHKGKVLIKLADENTSGPVTVSAVPRIKFDPEKVFIIIGGLGGIGVELASWLLAKGARKIILNSRRNAWNGYQKLQIDKWHRIQNVVIKVDLNDTSLYEGAENLILEAQKLGNIGGIFNSALVLRDYNIFNQTPSTFKEVFKPKVQSSENMDIVTRKNCPTLDHFVVFSSVTSGRGNAGQTNYGMANSAMEKLCENRRINNLPGLAVQWGPVGNVGVFTTEIKRDVLLLEPQQINSCLNALEKFMIHDVIVGSSLISNVNHISVGTVTERTPANTVAHILGLENIDSVDGSQKLYEFGLDSLMVTEIKQTLYRNFQLDYDAVSIREFSFDFLQSL